MLYQNITTILAALLGGLLTIVGGVVANYYIRSTTDRTSRRKELRNILEKIYQDVIEIDHLVFRIQKNINIGEDNGKNVLEIVRSMKNIYLIVDLYIPPLENDFAAFEHVIIETVYPLEDKENYKKYEELYRGETSPPYVDARNKFIPAIKALLKKEGYTYF